MTTITNATDHATQQFRDAAARAWTPILELSAHARKVVHTVRETEGGGIDTWLDRLRLQRRRSPLGPVLWLSAVVVAAGIAVLLIAPTTGKALRRRLAHFIRGETSAHATPPTALGPPVEGSARCEPGDAGSGARHLTV
jgi:hypothetical protein